MKKIFWFALTVVVLVASLAVAKPVLSQETIPMNITEISIYDGLATDVNESGQVVGYYNEEGVGDHAFLWSTFGGLSDLGLGQAYSINDLGQIVGGTLSDGVYHAFLQMESTEMQDIHTLDSWWSSIAFDINNQGQVAGCLRWTGCSGWCILPWWDGAFIWSQETGMINLTFETGEPLTCAYDINENSQVIGDSENGPFIWTPGIGVQYITSYPDDFVYGINDAGQVTGTAYIGDPDNMLKEEFVWSLANGFTYLGIQDGGPSFINDLGQVTSTEQPSPGYFRGVFWSQETGLLPLPELTCENPVSHAGRSNTSGQIAGTSCGHPTLWAVELPPPTPQKQIAVIDSKVDSLVNSGVLDQGEGTALISKLDAATVQVNKGNNKAARNILGAFVNTVEAFVNSNRLTSLQAQPLINATNIAIDGLQ